MKKLIFSVFAVFAMVGSANAEFKITSEMDVIEIPVTYISLESVRQVSKDIAYIDENLLYADHSEYLTLNNF